MKTEDLAQMAVRLCKRQGAEQADALVIRQQEKVVSVFNQQVSLSSISEVTRITIRLFSKYRGAVITVKGSSEQVLEHTIKQTAANMHQAVPDNYLGLADPKNIEDINGAAQLEIFDEALAQLSFSKMEEIAKAGESAVAQKN